MVIEGVLGEIVARKRADVASRLKDVSLADLHMQAKPTLRSFKDALARPGARFVMEVKKASPSQGALRPAADTMMLARAYHGVADAISVLTDEPYFGGGLDDLASVRSEFDGPILAKDFIVDPRQVPEARIYGADAILVMLSISGNDDATQIIAEADRLGMDALVEAHDEDEVKRAVALGAQIIGINNRNLKTLKVDLATTERLASLVPADRLVITESGIENRADVERLATHADAFLVGSSLVRANDPAEAARSLVFGRVKICGVTNKEDLAMATKSGAAYIGLIMVPNTPRAVTLRQAEAIAAAGKGRKIVGVFRNEKVEHVALAARRLRLHAVQLHGEEDAGYIRGLKSLLPEGCEIWAAGAVGDRAPEPRLGADRTLFDTAIEGNSGGTGRVFDWTKVAKRDELKRGLLAGGLTPANARAASQLGAYALDVGSGVEQMPGRKDAARMSAFFEALRLPVRAELSSCC